MIRSYTRLLIAFFLIFFAATSDAQINPVAGAFAVCQGSSTNLTDATSGGSWSSSNTAVATVGTGSGTVYGVVAGTTIITYTATGGYATATVTVCSTPPAITGNTTICVGYTATLSNAISGGTWISGDNTIATVGSGTGTVTGVAGGSVDITYSTPCGDVTITMNVNSTGYAPIISSLSASSGYPTGTLTIWGGNFNADPASNIVYFGATMASVTASTGGYELDVVVPIGASFAPVSVEDAGCGLIGYSQYPFLPNYDNSAFVSGNINFDPIVDFTTGSNPFNIAIKDLDGDGKPDIAVTNVGSNTVSVFRNTGSSGSISSGSFATKVDFATSSSPYAVRAEDIDGDGKPDLVIANEVSNTVSVLRNTATSGAINSGSFAAAVDFTTGTNPVSMSLGDIDQDGKVDVVVANYFTNTISVLHNTATVGTISGSSFASKVDFTTGTHPLSVALGDIDADGLIDIVVANQGSNSISIFRNISSAGYFTSGSLASKVDFTTDTQPVSVAIGDINGDGQMDIAVANTITRTISVFPNAGAGSPITSASLGSKVTFVAGVLPFNIAMGDIDGDGKVDMAVTCEGNSRSTSLAVSVYRNTSGGTITTGSFASKVDYVMTASPRFVAIGDLDGDKQPDLAVSIVGSDKISVLRYNSIPSITGTTSICGNGNTTTLSDASSGGTWTSSTGSVATVVAGTGVVTSVSAGSTTITYTVPAGNFVTTIFMVTATPASITGTVNVCVGATTTLSDATSGGTWSGSTASVATVGSGTGVVTGVSSGTATITYATGVGCIATAIVTVNPTAITGTSAVCAGTVTTLSDGGGGAWTSSNTSAATVDGTTGDVTGVSAGTTLISYTLSGCTTTKSFTVISAPAAITGSSVVCAGSTATLTDGGGGTWTSGNTSVATMGSTTGIVYGVASGTASVTYSLGTSCYVTKAITVVSSPASITGTAYVCVGVTTALSDGIGGGTWSSGSTSVATIGSASGIATGVAAGTTTITYSLGAGCTSIQELTVTASPAVITGTNYVCENMTTALSDATGSGTWESSATSIATVDASGVVYGVLAGTTTISYTVGSSCYAVSTVTVNAAAGTITGPAEVCIGSTTNLDDPGGGLWTTDNTSIATVGSTTGLVYGVSDGTVDITYTLSTGCMATVNVTVDPLPGSIIGGNTLCIAAVTTLSDAGGGSWSSSDNSIATANAATGDITGVASGTATITYTVSTGCAATTAMTVYPSPSAITGTTAICINGATTLSDASSGGNWSTNDITVATIDLATGAVAPVSPGTTTVTYTFSSTGCYAVAGFSVNPLPSTISGTRSVCAGSTSTLADAGGGTWISTNTSVATIGSSNGIVNGVSAGSTTITYTLGTGCYTTSSFTVTAVPTAISGSSACVGSTATLSDASGSGTWSSTNMSVATIGSSSGVLTGVASGTTTITFTSDAGSVTVGGGCYTTEVFTVYPAASSITGTASVCVGLTTTLSDGGGGTWASSDNSTASIGSSSGVVSGVGSGNATITYTLPTGCYAIVTATVNPMPFGITGNSSVCAGSTITLSDGTSAGTWSSSNTSVATAGSGSGVVSGVVGGTSTISYTLATGCYATANITVNSLPAAITGNMIICTSLTTALSDATPGGTWTSGNTSVATVGSSSGVVSGVSIGTALISYNTVCGVVTATVTVNGAGVGAPTVTSLSAVTGYPAASITITGTNFNSVIANNIVYFGATMATVSSASTTSLTVTVPTDATYMPVSVDNTSCLLIGYSQYPFLPTYNNSSYVSGTVNFSAKVDFASASNPYSVAIGDIDGDGKADIVAVNLSSNSVSVYRNTSSSGSITSGSFASKVDFNTGTTPYGVAIGDIDGDGKLDLAIANNASNSVSVLRNTASSGSITSGSFAAKVDFATGTNPIGVTIADIDMDGKPDLVSANFYSNTISILRNVTGSGISSGSFAAKVDFTTATHPYSVAVGDLDGDGKPDIAVANQGSASVSVFRNTSTSGSITSGSLAAKVDFTTGSNPYSVAIGDIDGDGKMDLAVANNGSNSVSVFRNTASSGTITSGSFATKVDFTTGTAPYNVSMGDIDGDGKVDLVTSNASSNTVSLFHNTASSGSVTSGSLASKADFATGSSPRFVAVGDLDGDGKPDFAVANLSSNTVSVIRNNPISPISGTATLCAGSTTSLSDAATGGVWTSSNTSAATVVSGTGMVTGVAAGTSVISYTLAGGSATITVTVNAASPSITGTASVCAGATTTLSDATGGGTWTSSANSVATVGTGGVVGGVVAGTSTITYSVTASCFVTKIVTVNPLPASITGASSLCTGLATTLSNGTSGGTWSSSNTSVATAGSGTGVISGVAAGTTTITYALGTGCYVTTSLTVLASPAAVTGIANACIAGTTTLSDATGGGTWSSVTTSVATVGTGGVVSGVASGTSIISYTTGSGCTATITVTVVAAPGSITGTTNICTGTTTTLSDGSSGGTWSSSTTAVATAGSGTGVVTGVTAGATTITYALGAGCYTTTAVTVFGPPTVSTLSISAGYPAASVTITGTNFNSTAASNIVFFGAAKATVSSASATSISVAVPADATYMPVSVDNTTCALSGYSQYPFLPTYDNSAYYAGSINFSAKVDFASSSNPYGVAIGDLDGDGKSDIVAVNLSSNTVSVYRNTSSSGAITSGSFAAKTDFAVGTSPYSVAIADLDGDGKLDLAVANNSSNTVSVLRNTSSSGTISSGSFATKVDFATGTNPMCVTIGDIDGDGRADIATANFYSGTVSVLRSTASSGAITSGSFAAKVDFTAGNHPYCVALGDIDGDGKRDMVVVNQGSATMSVFRNTSTAGAISSSSFAAKVDFTTGTNPYSVAIGDIDGDGKMDVVVVNNGSTSISVFRNSATSGTITSGSFAGKVDFTTGSSPYFVALGDIDGDGKVDVAVINSTANTVSIMRNTAVSGTITTGSLAAKIDFATGSAPRCLAIGDLDGDGQPDIAVANIGANTVSVLRNAPVVHPGPIGTGNNATVSVCVGANVTLNDNKVGGVWSTDNSNIAVVDAETGMVTGIAAGRTLVTYTVADGSGTTNDITAVVVNPLPDAVVITANPGLNIRSGESLTLAATVRNGGTLPVYQWSVNGAPVPGATAAAFTSNGYLNDDIVACTVGSSGGCGGYVISNRVIVKVDHSNDNLLATGQGDIRVLPNPNSGSFIIKGSLGAVTDEEVNIELLNVLGQVIYNSKIVAANGRINEQVKLDNSLPGGAYILNIVTGVDHKIFHIMVER